MRSVLEMYLEFADGQVRSSFESAFDSRLLNYRIDVERVLERLPAAEYQVLMSIHRDGLAFADALKSAGIEDERPDLYVAHLETKVGRLLEEAQLSDIVKYVQAPRTD
jgi:hypothetical protein